MEIFGIGKESYLYLSGLKINKEIHLRDNIFLLPTTHRLNIDMVSKMLETDVDFGIAIVFAKSISSSLKIVANNPEELAISSWNSLWDLLLLSAVFETEVTCNFQSTHSLESLNEESVLRVTNYHLRGLLAHEHEVSEDEIV